MRRFFLVGGIVGLFMLILAVPGSAYHEWCRAGWNIIPNRLDSGFSVGWRNCIVSSGQGHELAITTFGSYRNGQIAGNYVIGLYDNNYAMAFSPHFINPYIVSNHWAGWIYHPYWGYYCSKVWYQDVLGYGEAVPSMCAWTNGYQ